ncbi:hypothetical protein BKA69DRAFT_1128787 [Paraphysoderma sedebokerense]|nr:hypothetical protein BKA69DRAFT_1128787 [Paraphysoderma sedebokerense]
MSDKHIDASKHIDNDVVIISSSDTESSDGNPDVVILHEHSPSDPNRSDHDLDETTDLELYPNRHITHPAITAGKQGVYPHKIITPAHGISVKSRDSPPKQGNSPSGDSDASNPDFFIEYESLHRKLKELSSDRIASSANRIVKMLREAIEYIEETTEEQLVVIRPGLQLDKNGVILTPNAQNQESAEFEKILYEVLPMWGRELLSRDDFVSPETGSALNQIIRTIVFAAIRFMNYDIHPLNDILSKILTDFNSPFYVGTADMTSSDDMEIEETSDVFESPFYHRNRDTAINRYDMLGSFRRKLQVQNTDLNLRIVFFWTHLISTILSTTTLERPDIPSSFNEILLLLKSRIEHSPEIFLTDRRLFSSMLDHLTAAVSQNKELHHLRKQVDIFRMEMALICTKSSKLDFRLLGVIVFRDCVHKFSGDACEWNKDEETISAQVPLDLRYSEEDRNFLVKFMRENQILSTLFGPTAHLELLARSPDIILFISMNGGLRPAELDMLTQPLKQPNQHQSLVNAVLKVIEEVVQRMNFLEVTGIWERLKRVIITDGEQSVAPPASLAASSTSSLPSLPGINLNSLPITSNVLTCIRVIINSLSRHLNDVTSHTPHNPDMSQMRTDCITRLRNISLDVYVTLFRLTSCTEFTAVNNCRVNSESKEVTNVLCVVLGEGPGREEREKLVELCVNNIKQHISVPNTLVVLHQLIRTAAAFTNEPITDYITRIVETYEIRKLLFDSLVYYHNQKKVSPASPSRLASNSASPKPSPTHPLPRASSSSFNVTQSTSGKGSGLSTRLEFFRFLTLPITGQSRMMPIEASILWDQFILDAVSLEERNYVFSWLTEYSNTITATSALPAASPVVTWQQYLFLYKWPELDVQYLSLPGFCFLRELFVKVNTSMNRMIVHADSDTQVDIKVIGDLVGSEHLWTVALSCLDEEVGQAAIAFLVLVHLNLPASPHFHDTSPTLPAPVLPTITDTATRHLFSAAQNLFRNSPASSPDSPLLPTHNLDSNKFGRCLEILKKYIDSFESRYPDLMNAYKGKRHGLINNMERITIKVRQLSATDSRTLALLQSDTVGTLRAKIADMANVPISHVWRLIAHGNDVLAKGPHTILSDVRISNETMVHYIIRIPEGDVSTDNSASVRATDGTVDKMDTEEDSRCAVPALITMHPSYILSQPNNFDRFFQMLQLPDQYSSKLWEFLMILPTNEAKLTAIKELDTSTDGQQKINIDWPALFDSQSPYRLLYAVQIVNALIHTSEDGSDWLQSFIQKGGINHLLHVLVREDLQREMKREVVKSCIYLLLKVVDDSGVVKPDSPYRLTIDVDVNALVSSLTSLIDFVNCIDTDAQVVTTTHSMSIEHKIHRESLSMLFTVILANPTSVSAFFSWANLSDWLFNILVGNNDDLVRTTSATIICQFIEQCCERKLVCRSKPMVHIFAEQLWKVLGKVEDCVYAGKQYFETLSSVLSKCMNNPNEIEIDAESLVRELLLKLKQHQIAEDIDATNEDTFIIGACRIIIILLRARTELQQDQSLLESLTHCIWECLFDIPTTQANSRFVPPKCKSYMARKAGFELLYECSRDSPPTFSILARLALEQIQDHHLRDVWDYSPNIEKRNHYVGLTNLGATCYMNSITQQFFMDVNFRKGILAAQPFPEKADSQSSDKDDDLLYQLQIIFSNLQESERKAFNAYQFTRAYKDYDGQSMNPYVQMDVDEYFNMLFDKLETKLKGTPQENLLKNHFGGILLHQIKSQECEHVSEREESFFAIQCEIKNKRTIQDSLQLYVEGEILDGDNKYRCDQCQAHVDAIKRTCIRSLPDNLILHLKRFDFDMETMRRIKINDYFEFPFELDMENFVLKGGDEILDTNMFRYELAGVLVHTGTADSGHYYSFIKERKPRFGDAERKWFHFNDSNVELFDPKDVPSQCYGGSDSYPQYDAVQQKSVPKYISKPNNAYMLFYQRVNQVNDVESAECSLPPEIYQSVWADNVNYLRDRNVFDSNYFSLIQQPSRNLLQYIRSASGAIESDNPRLSLTIKLVSQFFLSVMIRGKDRQCLNDCVSILQELFTFSPSGCEYFVEQIIDENRILLQQALLSCWLVDVRKAFVGVTVHALTILRKSDPSRYGLTGYVSPAHSVPSLKPDSLIGRFLTTALEMPLGELQHYWRNFNEFFDLLLMIASFGLEEKAFMVEAEAIATFVEFYLSEDSNPDYRPKSRRRMGDKESKPNFKNLLSFIARIMEVANLRDQDVEGKVRVTEEDWRMLSHEGISTDKDGFRSLAFIQKQVQSEENLDATKTFIRFWASQSGSWIGDPLYSLFHLMMDKPGDTFECAFQLLMNELDVEDKFREQRFRLVLDFSFQYYDTEGITPHNQARLLLFIQDILKHYSASYAIVKDIVAAKMKTYYRPGMLSIFEAGRDATVYILSHLVSEGVADLRNVWEGLIRELDKLGKPSPNLFHQRRGIAPFGFQYSQLLHLIRELTISREQKVSLINNLAHSIFRFYDQINNLGHNTDGDKAALLRLILLVLEGDCTIALHVGENGVADNLMGNHILVTDSRDVLDYNDSEMPIYYRILLLLSEASERFRKLWLEHTNLTWAISQMYWMRRPGSTLDETLKDFFSRMIEWGTPIREFRNNVWQELLKSKTRNGLMMHRLLEVASKLVIVSQNDAEVCWEHGMPLLSEAFEHAMKQSDLESPTIGTTLFLLRYIISSVVKRNPNADSIRGTILTWKQFGSVVQQMLYLYGMAGVSKEWKDDINECIRSVLCVHVFVRKAFIESDVMNLKYYADMAPHEWNKEQRENFLQRFRLNFTTSVSRTVKYLSPASEEPITSGEQPQLRPKLADLLLNSRIYFKILSLFGRIMAPYYEEISKIVEPLMISSHLPNDEPLREYWDEYMAIAQSLGSDLTASSSVANSEANQVTTHDVIVIDDDNTHAVTRNDGDV